MRNFLLSIFVFFVFAPLAHAEQWWCPADQRSQCTYDNACGWVRNGASCATASKNELLVAAVNENDTARATDLLSQGANANVTLEKHRTLLMIAAAFGNSALVDNLISKFARIDQRDDDGNFAATIAVMFNQTAVLPTLVGGPGNKYLILNVCNRAGIPLLGTAAQKGNAEAIKILLDLGAHADGCGSEGIPPLNTAISIQRPNIIRLLLQGGANPLYMGKSGRDAMGTLQLMSDISQSFADIDLASESMRASLFGKHNSAANSVRTKPAELPQRAQIAALIKRGIASHRLFEAAVAGDAVAARTALAEGAWPEVKHGYPNAVQGSTLHAAAYSGSVPILKMILPASGAERSTIGTAATNASGNSVSRFSPEDIYDALSQSLLQCKLEAAQYLVRYPGVSSNREALTNLLQFPFKLGCVEGASLLLAAGADPNPWFVTAVSHGDERFTAAFLAAHPDVQRPGPVYDYKGSKQADQVTPLIAAAMSYSYGHPDRVALLLAAGADPNARDGAGGSALYYARIDPTVIRELLAANAQVDAADKFGHTKLALVLGDTLQTPHLREVAQILVDAGASLNRPDGTPLTAWNPEMKEFLASELNRRALRTAH